MKGNAHDEQLQWSPVARITGRQPGSGMIEVFKTNVEKKAQASMLLEHFHRRFPECLASFDLEDCDRILRIESTAAYLNVPAIIGLLGAFGFCAEVLGETEQAAATPGLAGPVAFAG